MRSAIYGGLCDEAALADHGHLRAVLTLAGCGSRSANIASAMLIESGSLGGAFALSNVALNRLGVPSPVIKNLLALHEAQIAGLRRAVAGRTLVSTLAAALDYLHAAMAHLPVEEFRVLFLDTHHRLIRDEAMGRGTVDACPIYVREVISRALDVAASAIVLVHNHPSGSLEPSPDDVRVTKQIRDAAQMLDIRVHDHIIVTRFGHVSLRSLGVI